jgi:hypothetical protein
MAASSSPFGCVLVDAAQDISGCPGAKECRQMGRGERSRGALILRGRLKFTSASVAPLCLRQHAAEQYGARQAGHLYFVPSALHTTHFLVAAVIRDDARGAGTL